MEAEKTLPLNVIRDEIGNAIEAPKCHRCGCLHKTVEALGTTPLGHTELASILDEARAVFKPKQYDCLGCPVCFPAIAANAFAEAYPEVSANLDLCPTEEPEQRQGWPPLPGDYYVLRYQAPIAICTLNSASLATVLRDRAPAGLAIVGTMHTENLGIERLIRNTLANQHIRFLILSGEDTRQAIGHLPGQSLQSLFENGIDERGKIIGARGRRPFLKNVSHDQVRAFLEQIEVIPMIGDENPDSICAIVDRVRRGDPGPAADTPVDTGLQTIQATEPERLTLDKAGYFVVYPEPRRNRLVLEHYTNAGFLDCVIEGSSPASLYCTAIQRNLLTRLDHAAYLGRELARAEQTLKTGEPYVQGRAPGTLGEGPGIPLARSCGCSNSSNKGRCS